MISSQQIRAARGFLDWSRAELATRAKVNAGTIKNIEDGAVQPHAETMDAIERVFRANNVDFLANGGICPHDETLRVIEEGDPYLQALDDVFATVKDQRRPEVLFCFVRNQLSDQAVIESDLRLRRIGARFRSLIEEGDTFCLYPIREYRWVPRRFFQNNTQVIYATKVASMIGGNRKALVVNNAEYAETQRKIFNALWEHSRKPSGNSTAPEIYE